MQAKVVPVLKLLASQLCVPPDELQIWDPYFCKGTVVRHMAQLGFTKVRNVNEDFYQMINKDTIPEHHVFMTNPPYSSDHLPRCLEFCGKLTKPCLLLLPNWVAKKPYFSKLLAGRVDNMFFIAPLERYAYTMPPELVPDCCKPAWVGDDGKTSPFESSWYIILPPSIGSKRIYDRLESELQQSLFGCMAAKKLQALKWKLKKARESQAIGCANAGQKNRKGKAGAVKKSLEVAAKGYEEADPWDRRVRLVLEFAERGGAFLSILSLWAYLTSHDVPVASRPIRQESKVPVQPPSFQSTGFSDQVSELLELITPSEASERVATELAAYTESIIQEMLPGASVEGFANADILRGTAFGVAVPEIDLVVTADPECLERQLQGRLAKGGVHKTRMDARKMQKSAIRACTDLLVAAGGFKFRRSAFRCEEPKVTLMGPSTMSVSGQGIPVDFSVNCATPGCHAALVSACAEMDVRSRDLILLVRRWSKDRGVCHVARGHLSPYGWTLLTIYYLQVKAVMLPPLSAVRSGADYVVKPTADPNSTQGEGEEGSNLTVGDLFFGFIGFYEHEIDLQCEAVSLRHGQRQASSQPEVADNSESADLGVHVEDPFDPERNCGASLSREGLQRLKEELARAQLILSAKEEASLSEVLQPWAPPERHATMAAEDILTSVS
ncbi:URT1 [Symbiodinium pilosum]|uniref:URT1 protein n=1 Tax=Symbiodinium pilosum TaxID=2952 RepID=A0A812RDX8_SYMPI|nr:URT1 [Symbiodinium pilosum]